MSGTAHPVSYTHLINSDQVMIGGDSAGGNFAAAVTLMSRDRGIPSPSAAMLIYPVTDRRMITKSMEIYTDTPVWDSNLTKMVWDAYLGGRIPEKIEYASPLEAESLASFPPTYIEVAEYDALRDCLLYTSFLFFETIVRIQADMLQHGDVHFSNKVYCPGNIQIRSDISAFFGQCYELFQLLGEFFCVGVEHAFSGIG